MTEVLVPAGQTLDWYLSLEEQLAANPDEEMIFFWVVEPTVIYGRHQVIENEADIAYCRQHNIRLIRRKSGGGCVYADSGNLMISYITPSPHSEQAFARFMQFVPAALRKMGYPAVTTEHNDILVNGHKVSGTACYALTNSTIVHSTMLWDVDFDCLQHALTPPKEKLAKHGVESVRQRVANLISLERQPADYRQPINNIGQLQQAFETLLCNKSISLDTLLEKQTVTLKNP